MQSTLAVLLSALAFAARAYASYSLEVYNCFNTPNTDTWTINATTFSPDHVRNAANGQCLSVPNCDAKINATLSTDTCMNTMEYGQSACGVQGQLWDGPTAPALRLPAESAERAASLRGKARAVEWGDVTFLVSHLPGPSGERMCVSAVVLGGSKQKNGLLYSYDVRLLPCKGIPAGGDASSPPSSSGGVYQHWQLGGGGSEGGHLALADSPDNFACLFAVAG